MTLSFYLARRFLRSFALVLGVFALILFMVDLVEQIRRFDAAELGLRDLALLAALNLPQTLYAVLPLLMVMASDGPGYDRCCACTEDRIRSAIHRPVSRETSGRMTMNSSPP